MSFVLRFMEMAFISGRNLISEKNKKHLKHRSLKEAKQIDPKMDFLFTTNL